MMSSASAYCILNKTNISNLVTRTSAFLRPLFSNSISTDAASITNAYTPTFIDGIDHIESGDGKQFCSAGVYGFKSKLKLAIESGMLNDTIGIDVVATCVNDLVTTGAQPWYFEYFLPTRPPLDVDYTEKVSRGITSACCHCDIDSLSEKKAPEMSAEGELVLGGIAYGSAKTDALIGGKNIVVGDVLVGLPSSGLHSYGFSLVKRVLEASGSSLTDNLPGTSIALGESLMSPTVIYVKQVLDIISKGGVKGIAQIKYGGLANNIPRIFPTGLGADIFNHSWVVPPIFKWIQEAGRVDEVEMRETFNMGIVMVLVVSKETALRLLGEAGGENAAYRIGEVVSGSGVRYR